MSRRRKTNKSGKRRANSFESRGYTKESLNMLKSKEGQINLVFACFGSACQRGQLLEEALGDLVSSINELVDCSLSATDLKDRDADVRKKTMGQLFRHIKKYATISDESIMDSLEIAIRKRNFLAHRYFIERDMGFDTRAGRTNMLEELVTLGSFFDRCSAVVRGITIAMRETQFGARDQPRGNVLFTVTIQTTVSIPAEFKASSGTHSPD